MVLDPKKQNVPKEERSLKDAPMPPLPFAKDVIDKGEEKQKAKSVERITHKEGSLTLDEASILLKNIEEKGKKIKKKLDELFETRKVSPDFLEQYLNNPSNFSPSEWEALNEKRRELVNSFNVRPELKDLGKQFASIQLGRAAAKLNPSAMAEAKAKEFRKAGKAQRRGWLPMR